MSICGHGDRFIENLGSGDGESSVKQTSLSNSYVR